MHESADNWQKIGTRDKKRVGLFMGELILPFGALYTLFMLPLSNYALLYGSIIELLKKYNGCTVEYEFITSIYNICIHVEIVCGYMQAYKVTRCLENWCMYMFTCK